jgi:hypothetical protein
MNKKRCLVIVGVVVAAVLLAVLLDTMLVNHRPAIISLGAEPEGVLPRGSCQIVCNATDRDGDELSYNWSASEGNISGAGVTVNWTAPPFLGSYNVTVIVTDGRGGEVTDYVTITVTANRPPTITSLIADTGWTLPLGTVQVTCDASDPNYDELSYEWTATAGSILGTSTVVNWIAPKGVGAYNVTAVVKDGYGGKATRFVTLYVDLAAPPTIEKLTVIAKDPKYLKTTSSGYMVGRTEQYDIACNVSDTSEGVSYNWSCESGVISGEGSMITWTAPDESLERTTVTVIVSDVAGNMVAKSIVFKVASCSSCTFG